MSRNASLDYARLLAAIGIVWFHSGAPGAHLGYAALPFFLMLTEWMAFATAGRMSFAPYVLSRLNRLMLPFAAWSLVYGGLKLVEIALSGRPLSSEFAWWMLATGPALHLWFLPFATLMSIAIFPLANRRWTLAGIIVSVMLLYGRDGGGISGL